MVTARMVGRPAYLEAIEGMDGELTKVIKEFVHAVDVEALRFAKRISRHLLSQNGDSPFSVTSCRPKRSRARGARSFDSAVQTHRDWLSPRPLLYGRHPESPPQGNHRLGGQYIRARRCSPRQYILDLQLTWHWKDVLSTFHMRKP